MSDTKKTENRIKYLEKKVASYKDQLEESKVIINKQRMEILNERSWRVLFRQLMQEAVEDDDFRY
jgi:uncharacterized coiled-coil protein SlyX